MVDVAEFRRSLFEDGYWNKGLAIYLRYSKRLTHAGNQSCHQPTVEAADALIAELNK
jgi:CRISPR/Cas system-associated protein endoribonuclease Cas2